MSIIKGKTIKINGTWNDTPAIRYVRGRDEYVFKVPDMYDVIRNKDIIGTEEVYITGQDLWRLIKFDKWFMNGNIPINEEKCDLDDSTYLGVSWVQANYYVSRNTMNIAKRLNGKFSHSQWYILKKRVPRGGRPVGGGKRKQLSPEEIERMEYLTSNYDRIVANCIEKDWVSEYIELECDIAKFKGEKKPSRKQLIQTFTELRQEWLNKN